MQTELDIAGKSAATIAAATFTFDGPAFLAQFRRNNTLMHPPQLSQSFVAVPTLLGDGCELHCNYNTPDLAPLQEAAVHTGTCGVTTSAVAMSDHSSGSENSSNQCP